MSDVDDLMEKAQKQLAEHVTWLVTEIEKIPADVGMTGGKILLQEQARQIRLRMVRADNGVISVVYEYQDELGAFLCDTHTPLHLRQSLDGGHLVNTDQPAFTAKRTNE